MYGLVKSIDVLFDRVTSCGYHALNFFVLSEFLDDEWCLHCKLSRWHQNQTLDRVWVHIDFLKERNWIRGGLTSTILGSSDDVLAFKGDWNGLFLNWGWVLVALLVDSQLYFFWESEIWKFQSLCTHHILCFVPHVLLGGLDTWDVKIFWCGNGFYLGSLFGWLLVNLLIVLHIFESCF